MKKYTVRVDVDQAVGYQWWKVKANSEEDAIEKYRHGKIIDEEVDIIKTSDACVIGVEECED